MLHNLAPAKVKATTNGSGSIQRIVGITTGDAFKLSTEYNHLTGQLQVTTSSNHGFREFVRLDGMVFNH